MKKLVFVGCIVTLGIIATALLTMQRDSAAIAFGDNPYTCQANGTFSSLTSGPAAITTNDSTRSASALSWLRGQLLTESTITTASTITPDSEYPSSHTGAIDGIFSVQGASYTTKNDAPLVITSPSTLTPTYSSVVQGDILVTPTAWRWIIQVYKLTPTGYVQVPKQALADATTGEFTIDLSDIANPPEGEWAFGLLDAENGYAPYGTQWPSTDYYDGIEVQQKLVTDAIYDWSSTRAYADGTFHFDNSNTGKKLFRLVDTSTGAILAEHVQLTGLVRSYELDESDPAAGTSFESRSFVYDQALALFAALSTNDEALATQLVDGLLTLQETTGTHNGGFVFAAPQLTPSFRDSLIRTGAHAIATDALLAYIQKYPSAQQSTTYITSATAALDFLNTTLSVNGPTSGLYLGGYGDYSGAGNSFNGAATISWASTEHNIDTWHVFVRAAQVLGSNAVNYTEKALALKLAINEKLYNASERRLNQGMTTTGPDDANPLDINSWGAIQLYASGEFDKAHEAIDQLPLFQFTRSGVTGYAPFYDSPGYPGAVPNVWFEGSFGVALALLRIGDTAGYRTLINELATAQQGDGSFVYATDPDPTYEIVDRKAVASTAWYILATTGRDAIWNSCTYIPPETPITNPPATTPPTQQQPSNSTPRSQSKPGVTGAQVSDITSDSIALSDPETIAPEINEHSSSQAPTTAKDSDSANKTETKQNTLWLIFGGIGLLVLTLLGVWIAVRRTRSIS